MAQDGRGAVIAGLAWGLAAAVVAGATTAYLTDRPATRAEPGGEVVSLKGPRGPDWSLAVVAGGAVGTAARLAGAAWRYTRPD
jgi:hypothetical protein